MIWTNEFIACIGVSIYIYELCDAITDSCPDLNGESTAEVGVWLNNYIY